jgi:hypothetical protein
MIIQELKDAIKERNISLVSEKLAQLEQEVHSNPQVLVEFLKPVTITELHKLLKEMGVNPRLMQVRRRVAMPKPRAILFLKAMQIGVKHCE